jgi:hypothetical protein
MLYPKVFIKLDSIVCVHAFIPACTQLLKRPKQTFRSNDHSLVGIPSTLGFVDLTVPLDS